jgi:hypothetical protein
LHPALIAARAMASFPSKNSLPIILFLEIQLLIENASI